MASFWCTGLFGFTAIRLSSTDHENWSALFWHAGQISLSLPNQPNNKLFRNSFSESKFNYRWMSIRETLACTIPSSTVLQTEEKYPRNCLYFHFIFSLFDRNSLINCYDGWCLRSPLLLPISHKNGKRIYDGNKFYAFHIFFMLLPQNTANALDLNFILYR